MVGKMNDEFIAAYKKILTESANSREIPDDADFEKEMNNAIEAKEVVSFKYKKKDGTTFTMRARPFEMIKLKGETAVKVYMYGIEDKEHERTLYISSMGNGIEKPAETKTPPIAYHGHGRGYRPEPKPYTGPNSFDTWHEKYGRNSVDSYGNKRWWSKW